MKYIVDDFCVVHTFIIMIQAWTIWNLGILDFLKSKRNLGETTTKK
jgi:hypothetical protein